MGEKHVCEGRRFKQLKTIRGASALDVAIQLRQWAVDERRFGQSIEYSGERPPGARDALALERILPGRQLDLNLDSSLEELARPSASEHQDGRMTALPVVCVSKSR